MKRNLLLKQAWINLRNMLNEEKPVYRKAKSEAMVTETDDQMRKALIVKGQ